MAKKYVIPEDEPQMVGEPAVAVSVEMVQQKMPVFMLDHDTDSYDDIPKFILKEIDQAIIDGDCELANGEWFTHEDVMSKVHKLLES